MDDRQFIVFDKYMNEYILSVDVYDSDIDFTANRKDARIFRGSTWREYFSGNRYRLVEVD